MGDPGQIHRNVLWAARLLEMLERVGFVGCRRIRYWRSGYDRWPYDLKYKEEHGRHVVRDLVVEAFKPQRQVRPLKPDTAAQAVFSDIYRSGAWAEAKNDSSATFYSGPGSDDDVTLEYREFVARFIAQHGVKSVVDIGCGDFRVGRHWVGGGIDYVGVDVVPDLIEHNRAHFGAPNVQFVCADASRETLPTGDLCLVRQVLQHLSNHAIKSVLKNVEGFRHVLITEHYPASALNEPNIDIRTGQGTRVDIGSAVVLDAPPFNINATLVLQTMLPNGEFLNTFLIERPQAAGD